MFPRYVLLRHWQQVRLENTVYVILPTYPLTLLSTQLWIYVQFESVIKR
jgi:hypothetical protein